MDIHSSNPRLNVHNKPVITHLAEPEGGGRGVLLLHAWWGLKPFFKTVSDRLAREGFIVFAPDLWEGRVVQTIEEAQELASHSFKNRQQETQDILQAATDYLLHLPGRRGEKIGVVGFSMGAFWTLVLAAERPDDVGAAVVYYGTSPMADVTRLRAKVLGHFSDVDKEEPYEDVKALEKNMQDAGVDVDFEIYPGKAHWFVEEDRPEYDAEAARLAWDRTVAFLKANL